MADKLEAFLVSRDEEGRPVPYEVEVPGIRDKPLKIMILPTTLGSLKELQDPEANTNEWPLEDKIKYVRDHVVDPPFSELLPEDFMNQMTLWDLDMILIAAVQKGGPMRQRQEKKKPPTEGSGRSRRGSRR